MYTPFFRKRDLIDQGYNPQVEKIRRDEYPQIRDAVYLDHSGTTLYSSSLVKAFTKDLLNNLYGNPHSHNPSSTLSSDRIEAVRLRVLGLFKADPAEYDVVFCANATAAIKLVADSFAGHIGGFEYKYHRDVHTSLVGVRELATSSQCFDSEHETETWLSSEKTAEENKLGLFAWPGQSNFSGHRLPQNDWSGLLRSRRPNYYSLFDAAALAMTKPIDFSNPSEAPDFMSLSFYKMFGFPNLGALIVRRASAKVLVSRRYFGGGTVDSLIVNKDWKVKRTNGDPHEFLEDGTCAFHSIIALGHAMTCHSKLFGGFAQISLHTSSLASFLTARMSALVHPKTGIRVVDLYCESEHANTHTQGPVITFNLRSANGGWIGYSGVESAAAGKKIHIRTGGHCNPGGVSYFCGLSGEEMERNFKNGHVCGDGHDVMNGKPTGAVRVSLGAMTTIEDVLKFLDFIKEEYVEKDNSKWRARGGRVANMLCNLVEF
ncbi:uncharacterized protein H6S33_011923 [Morchella sextelata]|uniref:uncharacterized protein n=1 Tax=Morchella sextelata TaxID=1174677 RepID=UPI001D051515|nr:uncharacterized protein H6S33_011923 [Morchella sextelata]KAH0610396.1 hypothetical protein H6S33_011923 [Morchella sextelata]